MNANVRLPMIRIAPPAKPAPAQPDLARDLAEAHRRLTAMDRIIQDQARRLARLERAEQSRRAVPLAQILSQVVLRHGVEEWTLASRAQSEQVAAARLAFCQEATDHGFSQAAIGEVLGGRAGLTIGAILRRGRGAA
jgi:chromosomal replication initiation ATPase DnaA